MFQYSRHELRKFVGRRSAIGVTDAHTTKVPIMLAFQAVYFIYISALFSSKNSSCTLNYCVFFSRILMNEIWCLFLSSKRQGSWFNMAAPLCIYINDKDTQNKVSYINNGRSPPFTFWLIIYLRSFLLLTIYIFVFRKSIMFCMLFYRIWIEKRSIFTHVFMEAVYIATSNSITLKVHVHN